MASTYFDRVSSTYPESCKIGIHGFFKSEEAKGLRSTLLKYYPESYEGKIVDIGCGSGFYTEALRKTYSKLHFTGVDPSSGMIEQYRRLGLRGVHSSIESLSDQSIEFFDILLVCGVMEFVKDIDRFIRSLKVLSRSEATLFAIVPKASVISMGYFVHHKLKNEIYIRFAKRYIQSFESLGFKNVERLRLTSISELLVFKIVKK